MPAATPAVPATTMIGLPAKLMLSPVLVAQALLTRARMPRLPEAAGPREGVVGRGPALRLLVAGDSSAAGVGVPHQEQALALPLARLLARQGGALVAWRLVAASGLTTAQLLSRLQAEPWMPFDYAVIVSGVNDVIEQVPSHHAVAARDALANWLRNAHGVRHVSFAPLPPVHRFTGLPHPLRWVAGTDARRHNDAMRRWAATRSDVSVAAMSESLEPAMMAEDGFHPGAPVYQLCATSFAAHLAALAWPNPSASGAGPTTAKARA